MKTLHFWEIALLSIIIGYIVGHILTTLSSIILVIPLNLLLGNPVHTLIGVEKPLIDKLSPKLEISFRQKIADKIKIKFGREIDKHSFFLCENYVRNNNKELGFLIRKRHAFEHLFRNLFISEILLLFLFDFDGIVYLIWWVILLITFLRYFDYRVSWPKVAYENFYIMKDNDNFDNRQNED